MAIFVFVYKAFYCIAFMLALLHCAAASGQSVSLGAAFSLKGAGAMVMIDNSKSTETDIISIDADMYGVYSGRAAKPGVSITYTHDYYFSLKEFEHSTLTMHAGAGVMAGLVHDFEEGYFKKYDRDLERHMGWAAALAGNIGASLDFSRDTSLDISISAFPGLFFCPDKEGSGTSISLYHNGLYHAVFPQVCIMHRF